MVVFVVTYKLKAKIPTHLVELKASMNAALFLMFDVWVGSIRHMICTCGSMCFCSITIYMNHMFKRNTKIVFFCRLYNTIIIL